MFDSEQQSTRTAYIVAVSLPLAAIPISMGTSEFGLSGHAILCAVSCSVLGLMSAWAGRFSRMRASLVKRETRC